MKRWWIGFALLMVLALVAVDAYAQVFEAPGQFTDQLSSFMYSKLGKTIGIIATLTVTILGITSRGHGSEILLVAAFMAVGLFFLFGGPRYIFPLLGFEPF